MSTILHATHSANGIVNPFPVPPVIPAVELRDAGDWQHWIVRLSPVALPVAVYPGPSGLDCAKCNTTRTCAHRLAVLTSPYAPAEPAFARPVTDEDVDDVLAPVPSPTDELRAALDAVLTLTAQFETALFASRYGCEIRPDVLRAARCATRHADAIRRD
jgi:hypothetical protein